MTPSDCEVIYRAAVADRSAVTAMALLDCLQEAGAPDIIVQAARRWYDRFGSCPDRTSGMYRIFTVEVYAVAYRWFGVDPYTERCSHGSPYPCVQCDANRRWNEAVTDRRRPCVAAGAAV